MFDVLLAAGTGVSTSYGTRLFAQRVLKQGDVTSKTYGTQLEDALLAGVFAALLSVLVHPTPTWLFLVGIPIATIAYTSIAEIPALRASLAKPTPVLLIVGGALATCVLGLYGYELYQSDDRMVSLVGTGVFAAWIGSFWLQKRMDRSVLKHPTVHIHHWMLGIGLMVMFGPFVKNSIVSGVMVTIGLALVIHAASVYRITSGACSQAVNCRIHK